MTPAEGPGPEAGDGREPAEGESLDADLAAMLGGLREIGGQLGRLASIRVDRARLKLRRQAFGAAAAVLFIVAAVTATVAGVARAVSGLAGGLGALLGRRWAGDVAAGVVVLLAVGGAMALAQAWLRRRGLRRMERRYAGEGQGDVGEGVPGSAGAAGDRGPVAAGGQSEA